MTAVFVCPKCKKRYTVSREDTKYLCPVCKTKLQSVPAPPSDKSDAYKETIRAESPDRQETLKPKQSASTRSSSSLTDIPEKVKEAMKSPGNIIAEKYVLVEKLGQGGMGAVYKSWDTSLRRFVAIKMILPSLVGSSASVDSRKETQEDVQNETIERFIQEAQTAAKLTHPNILQVHEVGRHKENYYIVMEYVDGGTLADFWEEKHAGPLKPSIKDIMEYVSLMKDVIKAIGYAHKHNIIHRDIKPENILLSAKRQELIPKVSDFGLAKETTSDKKLTISGTIVGTPVYMSPEQASAAKLDSRSDIFSLGSMLYKLCTGRDPFEGESFLEVMKAVANNDPVPPGKINKAVDKDMEVIILKAMEKDKDRRYAAAEEFAEDLERYINGEPIKARPASITYKITKRIKRNKVAFGGIGAAALILIAVLIGLWVSSASRQKTAQDYLNKADGFYKEEKWKDARDFYIKYLEVVKKDAKATEKMDVCTRKIKEKEGLLEQEAEEKKKAETASDEVQKAWLYASQAFQEFYKKNANMEKVWNQIDTAMDMLDKSIEKYPTAMGWFYKALLHKQKVNSIEAEKDLTEAIKLNPDFDLAYILRGIVYLEKWFFILSRGDQKKLLNSEKVNLTTDLELKAFNDFEKVKTKSDIPEQFEIYKAIYDAMRFNKQDVEKCLALLEESYKKYGKEEFLYWLAWINVRTSKDLAKAEEYIKVFIEAKPQDTRIYFLSGYIKREKKDLDGSIEDFNRIIQIDPNCASAYSNRGFIKNEMDDKDGAIADFNEAIRVDSTYKDAYVNRGAVRFNKGELDGAIEDASKAIQLDPNNVMAYCNRGIARAQKGDIEGALKDLSKAIQIDPNDFSAYYDRAITYSKIKDFDRAMEDFNSAIKINPDCAVAYGDRGFIKTGKGDIDGAIEDYNKAIKINPDSAVIYSNRAAAKNIKGDFDGAIEDCNIAIKLNPDSNEAFTYRGLARFSKGDIDGAIEDYDRAVQANPNYYPAYSYRGLAKAKKGDIANAIDDFNKALGLNPKSATDYLNRGAARSTQGSLKEAIEDFTRAIECDPKYEDAYMNRSMIFSRTGRYSEALADLQKVIEIDPARKDELEKIIQNIKYKMQK